MTIGAASAERPRVFVSWAGGRAYNKSRRVHLGTSLHQLLAEKVRTLHFYHASQNTGDVWRPPMDEALRSAQYVIVLLDAEAVASPWVGYETGFVHGRLIGQNAWPTTFAVPPSEPPRIFMLLTSADSRCVEASPFQPFTFTPLTREGLRTLAMTVAAWANDGAQLDVDGLHHALCEGLLNQHMKAQKDEQATNRRLHHSLTSTIARYAQFELITESMAARLAASYGPAARGRTPARTFEHQLADQLKAIERLLEMQNEDETFRDMILSWALGEIRETRRRLAEGVQSGNLQVVSRGVTRDFYRQQVMGLAEKSIWTTNLGAPGDTMGGTAEEDLIQAQRTAIEERHVGITRIFICPCEMAAPEIRDRKKVMAAQLKAGIAVFTLRQDTFHEMARNRAARRDIGGEDFMIIDDAMVYVTEAHKYESDDAGERASHRWPSLTATLYSAERHVRRMEAARGLSAIVEAAATRVTDRNIELFPSYADMSTAE